MMPTNASLLRSNSVAIFMEPVVISASVRQHDGLHVYWQPKLLDQLRFAIRAKHYSIRTEEAYVHWCKRFILFHQKRHPKAMREPEVAQFLNHLAVNEKVSSSTHNQALSAIVFFYGEVLGLQLGTIQKLERPTHPNDCPSSSRVRRSAGFWPRWMASRH